VCPFGERRKCDHIAVLSLRLLQDGRALLGNKRDRVCCTQVAMADDSNTKHRFSHAPKSGKPRGFVVCSKVFREAMSDVGHKQSSLQTESYCPFLICATGSSFLPCRLNALSLYFLLANDLLHLSDKYGVGLGMGFVPLITAAFMEEVPPLTLERFRYAPVVPPAFAALKELLHRSADSYQQAEASNNPPINIQVHQRRENEPADYRRQA